MTKISSGRTSFSKRGLPILLFGIVGIVVIGELLSGVLEKSPMVLAGPVVMVAFGYILMKKLVWDLVDEVYDGGDYLLVRNRGVEERVPLSGIMNVNASTMTNPPRITLRLVKPGKFGNEIAFSPVRPFTLNPFARSQLADDLIVRVDRARRSAGPDNRRG